LKRSPFSAIAILAVLGLSLCAALSRSFYVQDTLAIANDFQGDIRQAAAILEREVLLNLEVLYALKAAIEVVPGMDAERFKSITDGILERSPAIMAFAWAPAIERSRLADFELEQQRIFPDWRITERDADNQVIPVAERSVYVPVQFIAPLEKNRPAMGFDLASEAKRRKAIEASRDTGRLVATAGIKLVQESDNQQGFLVFAPLYEGKPSTQAQRREAHYGYINGVFLVGELTNQAIGVRSNASLLFQVVDVTDAQPNELYTNADPAAPRWVSELGFKTLLADVAGRTWQIQAMPSQDYIDRRRSHLPALIMVSGVLFIALLVIYALVNVNRNRALVASKDQLEKMSLTDGLTQLANRRHFDQFLEQEWARARRQTRTLSLVMLDIDYFKLYNDHYGHPAGDQCLKKVANILQGVVRRPTDMLARYGGEEFAIILPDTNDGGIIAEACRAAIEKAAMQHPLSDVSNRITISAGVCSIVPGDNNSLDDLKQQADAALYRAKHAGRNTVELC
tara:strand:+ start:39385 stop:40917 length:1533 start_codon:yes stop_codon:yes gene_type:complete